MTDALNLPNPFALKTPDDFRDLDGLIAVAFDGYWTRTPRGGGPLEYCRRGPQDTIRFGARAAMIPNYSTDDAAAIALLGRVYPEAAWLMGRQAVTRPGDKPYGVQLMFRGETAAEAEGDSLPLAIIAAMVLALPDGTLNAAREAVASYFADFSGLSS